MSERGAGAGPKTPCASLGEYPFEDANAQFPPVCLKTHWDPTKMIRHLLPQQHTALPESFRPWVKVCKSYRTSAPVKHAPMPPASMVFPATGGGSSASMPPGRYAANIDKESALRTLEHPLDRWCPGSQYVPRLTSDLFEPGSTLPERREAIMSAFVSELSMPQALLRTDVYSCRSANDTLYFDRSRRVFHNPTKQDRYGAEKYYALPDATRAIGQPMAHGGVPRVTPVAGVKRDTVFQQPGGAYWTDKSAVAHVPTTTPLMPASDVVQGTTTAGLAAPVW